MLLNDNPRKCHYNRTMIQPSHTERKTTMTKIRINKEKMINHATTLGDSAGKLDYYPLKNENMSYTQTNSIHLLRESLLELLEASKI